MAVEPASAAQLLWLLDRRAAAAARTCWRPPSSSTRFFWRVELCLIRSCNMQHWKKSSTRCCSTASEWRPPQATASRAAPWAAGRSASIWPGRGGPMTPPHWCTSCPCASNQPYRGSNTITGQGLGAAQRHRQAYHACSHASAVTGGMGHVSTKILALLRFAKHSAWPQAVGCPGQPTLWADALASPAYPAAPLRSSTRS